MLDWHTRAPAGESQDVFQEQAHINLHRHGAAKLLGENAAHKLHQRLTRFVQYESSRRVRPRQLETGGQRGNPNLAHRRIWADHESGFIRVFEQHFEFSAPALDFKSARIANFLKAAEQGFEGRVTSFLEYLFIHVEYR